MTPLAFAASALSDPAPPDGPVPLAALWWDRKGDWERGHEIVQADEEDRDAA